MAIPGGNSAVALTKIREVLVLTMRRDLDDESFKATRSAALAQSSKGNTNAVVLDFSAVDVLNLHEFNRARALLLTIQLLGCATAIVSLSASIVLYLTESQAETNGVEYFFNLDDALQHFSQQNGTQNDSW